jgi:hypothetical protein
MAFAPMLRAPPLQTPGHAAVNLALLGAAVEPALAPFVVAGAVLPDAPIWVLYADAKLRLRLPDARIWAEVYQRRGWLAVIHGAHSIPLGAAGLALSLLLRAPGLAAFFASLLLHAVADFPIHGEDAHRHFFPLSQWRFISPLSYWDPRRHARVVAAVELAVVFAACAVLWLRGASLPGKLSLAAIGAFYLVSYTRSFLLAPARKAEWPHS